MEREDDFAAHLKLEPPNGYDICNSSAPPVAAHTVRLCGLNCYDISRFFQCRRQVLLDIL